MRGEQREALIQKRTGSVATRESRSLSEAFEPSERAERGAERLAIER